MLRIIDENRFATGDEGGVVKGKYYGVISTLVTIMVCIFCTVWDQRQKDAIFSLKEMDDAVNDMIINEARRYLICSSAEGTITSIDLPNQRLHVQVMIKIV